MTKIIKLKKIITQKKIKLLSYFNTEIFNSNNNNYYFFIQK